MVEVGCLVVYFWRCAHQGGTKGVKGKKILVRREGRSQERKSGKLSEENEKSEGGYGGGRKNVAE